MKKTSRSKIAADTEDILDVESATGSLTCAICLGILVKPVRTPCSHWFCASCIQGVLPSQNNHCPTCREPATISSLTSDRLVQNLVSELAVRCPNHQAGCHWTGPAKKSAEHAKMCIVNTVRLLQTQVADLEALKTAYEAKIATLTATQMLLQTATVPETSAVSNQASKLQSEVIASDVAVNAPSSTSPCPGSTANHEGHFFNALLYAAAAGDAEAVRKLLDDDKFAQVNAVSSPSLETALHIAARHDFSDVARTLLGSTRFEAANACDYEGNTALHTASLHGSAAVAKVLLESTNFRATCLQNNADRTALHCAAAGGHSEVARLLLVSNDFSDDAVNATAEEHIPTSLGNVQITADTGWTALHVAAKNGHVDLIDLLLQTPRFRGSDASTGELQFTALHAAARYGHPRVIKALLESDAFVAGLALNFAGGSALHTAAYNGHVQVAEALLRSPKFQMMTSLADRMFEATALHSAASTGHAAVAALLLENEVAFPSEAVNAVTKHRRTALHLAAHFGHDSVVEVLLGAARFEAVNVLDIVGQSALHVAAAAGATAVVQRLLHSPRCMVSSSRSDSPKKVQGEKNPLHLAASHGQAEVAKMLLESKQFPDDAVNAVVQGYGGTALHLAVQSSHLEVVTLLVHSRRFRAHQVATSLRSQTAFHLAAARGAADIVEAMLASGRFAKKVVHALDSAGHTAFDIAVQKGHRLVAALLAS